MINHAGHHRHHRHVGEEVRWHPEPRHINLGSILGLLWSVVWCLQTSFWRYLSSENTCFEEQRVLTRKTQHKRQNVDPANVFFNVFPGRSDCISTCVLRHETHIHIFCWHVVTFCAFADLYRKTQIKRANSESGYACFCVRSCRSDVHFDTYFAAQNASAQLLRIIRWFFSFC